MTAPRHTPTGEATKGRPQISATQVIGSALASISAAVVASVFGVAGTIAGAAIVSVVATVGSVLYTHYLRSTRTWAQGRIDPLRRQHPLGSGAPPAPRGTGAAAGAPRGRHSASRPGGKPGRRPIRWVPIAVATAVVFASSIAAITLIELGAHAPVSSLFGNEPKGAVTSVGSVFGGGGSSPSPSTTTTTTTPASSTTQPPTTTAPSTTTTTAPASTTTTTSPGAKSTPPSTTTTVP